MSALCFPIQGIILFVTSNNISKLGKDSFSLLYNLVYATNLHLGHPQPLK